MKYIFTALLFIFTIGIANAQEVANDSNDVSFVKKYILKRKAKAIANAKKYDTYRVSGLGFGQAAVQDTRMALPVYKGISLGSNFSWREFSNKWYNEVQFEFAYSNLGFEGGSNSSYTHLRAFSNVSYLRKLKPESKFYLGAGIHFVNGFKSYPYLGNSSFNNDFAVSFNPEVRYQNDFNLLKRSFNFYSTISVNGFSYVNRSPAFSTGIEGTNNYFAPIGQFNRLRMTTGIHWLKRFSQENRTGLEYSWDFYGMNENDGYVKLRSAQHLLTLNFWFKTR